MRRMIQLVQVAKGTPVSCKVKNDCQLCTSEATGDLAYYNAGISEYRGPYTSSPLLTVSFSSAPSVFFW